VNRRFDPTELELMDRPQPVSPELENDLRNLRELNRWFGSHALISLFLSRWIKAGDNLRIVDLATGSGDIPRLVVEYARRIKANVQVDALDRQGATIEIAKRLSREYLEINFIQADLLEWQSSAQYDLVLCTLVLHHFSGPDALRVLQHCRDLSRKFVLVSDLRRGWLATGGVWFLTETLFRDEMTKYDGRLSAARSFSFAEIDELARRAGWKNFGHKSFPFARQAIWLEDSSAVA
jgi:2-polyprenyl-3-methyl-5-hydroxy-6-metoxy-1,4-benzoquinol methylase